MKADRKTALVLTISPWDEPKRLRKQLAEVLAMDMDVVYVTLPFGAKKPSLNLDVTAGNIRVLSLSGMLIPMRLVVAFKPIHWLYERVVRWRLQRKLRLSGEIHAVFCFTHLYPAILRSYRRERVIYVANDDHALMAHDNAAAKHIIENEARTILNCARVVSVSEVIARKLSRFGRPVHVMYPGHDCSVLPITDFEHEARVPRSVCFFGYIDWRVDFALFEALLNKGWSVTLVGKDVDTAHKIDDLKSRFMERFLHHPPVSPEQAPKLLTRYQVLIIPYRYQNEAQAEVMELPNKLFIYFAALRPIVTTWMPNLKFVESGLIYNARTDEEFLAYCELAVKEDSKLHAARRSELAHQNNWNSRRATLREIIDGTATPLTEVSS